MDTGTKVYRNYFPIKFGWQCDCQYGVLYPCFRKLMYPGDVFKVHSDLLIRYQPMLSPPMNDCIATVRFAFVPLRLLESNTELIVTGSQDGKLYNNTIPVMDSVFKYLDVSTNTSTQKGSVLDLLYGIPAGITLNGSGMLTKLDNSKASPAAYFSKAYYRFWWDFYRDENLYSTYADFDTLWDSEKTKLHTTGSLVSAALKKDRITSSLPWQLKSTVAPTIDVSGSASIGWNPVSLYGGIATADVMNANATMLGNPITKEVGYARQLLYPHDTESTAIARAEAMNGEFNKMMESGLGNVSVNTLGFNMAQLRELSAQTRIFERLARCGSRYTEYLRANFGIAPADDTLQRAQYLGGFKTRIVTTEVVQTAADGANPVGTLRGHGITHGSSVLKPFMAKEIGVMIGVLDIKPETIYAQGVDRELTARARFDFLNPSFQHLSEQEVRKGEVYFDIDTDANGNLVNDQTWGFQPYAQELRTGIKHVVGDMRDSLSYWNQSLIFSSRPSLNYTFIRASSHQTSYNRPFAVNGANAMPLIIDFGGVIEAYRPLVKNGTPGLTDHN